MNIRKKRDVVQKPAEYSTNTIIADTGDFERNNYIRGGHNPKPAKSRDQSKLPD